jgi:5'(3')-deoxyribonucleotidase
MKTIYLDMDGVVADFNSYAKKVLNTLETHHNWPKEHWLKIGSNPRLYRDLDKTPEADELVTFCQNTCRENNWNLFFLTAVPKDDDMPWAYYDKIQWVLKYYPDIPVFFGPHSNDKWKHCQIGDILIDDRPSNCEEWKKAGGEAILHVGDLIETINKLSALL